LKSSVSDDVNVGIEGRAYLDPVTENSTTSTSSTREMLTETCSVCRRMRVNASVRGLRGWKGTYNVGLEDRKDGLLGDELGKLDLAIILLILILGLVLVVGSLLELGVLDADDSASVALDLGTEL
jgi:hypothetical protein